MQRTCLSDSACVCGGGVKVQRGCTLQPPPFFSTSLPLMVSKRLLWLLPTPVPLACVLNQLSLGVLAKPHPCFPAK